jgi:hypothetical protein
MGLETAFERETDKRRGGEGKANKKTRREESRGCGREKSRSGGAGNQGINISNGILN